MTRPRLHGSDFDAFDDYFVYLMPLEERTPILAAIEQLKGRWMEHAWDAGFEAGIDYGTDVTHRPNPYAADEESA